MSWTGYRGLAGDAGEAVKLRSQGRRVFGTILLAQVEEQDLGQSEAERVLQRWSCN